MPSEKKGRKVKEEPTICPDCDIPMKKEKVDVKDIVKKPTVEKGSWYSDREMWEAKFVYASVSGMICFFIGLVVGIG